MILEHARSPLTILSARSITLAIFVLLAGVFLAFEFLFPRFPDIDEAFFKSAGRSLSEGRGFSAPELEGFLDMNPPLERVFFAQPPLYPWLFGQFVRGFGFSWRSCVGYDAVISILLSLIVFCVATYWLRLLASSERWIAAALLPAICTLLLRQPARPDELGMMLAYANLWLLLTQPLTLRTTGVSGCLAGFIICTSTGVAVAVLPVLATCFVLRTNWSDLPRKLTVAAAVAVIVIALCLLPLYFKEHTFYRQFFKHADTAVAGSPVDRAISGLALLWRVAPFRLWTLLATLPACALGLASRQIRPREKALLYIAPATGFLIVELLRPAFTYWWFLEPYFIIGALAGLIRGQSGKRTWTLISAASLALGLGCALVWPARGYFARISLPYDQQLEPSQERLRQTIPPGSVVLTSSSWWSLAGDHDVIDPTFSNMANIRRIDFFVAGNNGAGPPGMWTKPEVKRYADLLTTEFDVIRNDLPRDPLYIFGQHVSRSAYGFGTIVLQRKPDSRLESSAPADDHPGR